MIVLLTVSTHLKTLPNT